MVLPPTTSRGTVVGPGSTPCRVAPPRLTPDTSARHRPGPMERVIPLPEIPWSAPHRDDRRAALTVAFGFSLGLGVATVAIPLTCKYGGDPVTSVE